jgi:hypothetical protein
VLAVGVMTLTLALSGWKTASAINFGTLSASPSSPTVLAGNSFSVAIMSTSTSTTSAVQADVVFDKTKAQVTDVARGTAYDGTLLPANGPSAATIGLGFLNTPADKAAAIAAANSGGVLQGTSVYYNPAGGDLPVPAGTQQAFVVTMSATVNITVASVVSLTNVDMIDGAGAAMVVNQPCTPGTCTGSLTPVTSAASVTAGSSFTVTIQQTSAAYTSGVQADLLIDRSKVQVLNVARGLAYTTPLSGGAIGAGFLDVPATKAAAIASANTTTGVLQSIALYYSPPGGDPAIPPGPTAAIIVTLQAIVNVNNTALVVGLQNPEMLDVTGAPMAVTIPRNHAIDPNGDGYSAADEVTPLNCGVASCTSVVTFGTSETKTCKDAGRNCGTPAPVADELGTTRVAIPPATGYGCSVTLDTVGAKKTTKLAQSDVDLDGTVSILDLSKVASWFGQAVNPDPADPRWEGNLDGDGSISILDLSAMAANFGRSVSNNCKVE